MIGISYRCLMVMVCVRLGVWKRVDCFKTNSEMQMNDWYKPIICDRWIFSSQHNFTWWDGAIFAFSIHLLFWYYFVFSFKSIQIIYVRVGVCVSNANFSFIISAAQILHEVRTMYLRQFCMQILFLLILIGLSLFFHFLI